MLILNGFATTSGVSNMKLILSSIGLCMSLFFASHTLAQEAPTRQEVVQEVARITNLSTDIIDKALGEKPAWLKKLGSAVSAAQVVDKILSGKNSEVITDYVSGKLSDATQKFIEKILPTPVTNFFSIVKIYKDSLEFIRDYAFIPGLDARVYAEYKRVRRESLVSASAGGLVHNTTPEEAFDMAIYNNRGSGGGLSFKGYWTQYEAQYQALLKAKDYNPGIVGKKLEKHLKTKLDKFWINRLEISYQKEIMAANKKGMIDAIWANVQSILNQLMPQATIDASLFIDPATELPGNWWWVDKGLAASTVMPVENTGSPVYNIWRQAFTMSDALGFHLYNGKNWCQPKSGSVIKNCVFPNTKVRIFIMTAKTDQKFEIPATVRDSLDYDVSNYGFLTLSKNAAWKKSGRLTKLQFIVGQYLAIVGLSERRGSEASLNLAKQLGRVIAEKLKRRIDETKTP